jgi:hypothetical protein
MSENLRYWNRVCQTPKNAQKPIEAGRLKGKSDISPMWRIRMLTEMFGPCGIGWKVQVVEKEMIPGDGNEIRAFVHLNLYIRGGDQWSDPIPGFGGSSYTTKEKSGVYTDDECYKKAFTDAFGSACKLLGFSEDIYTSNYGSKHDKRQLEPQFGAEMMIVPFQPYAGMTFLDAYRKDSKYFFNVLNDPNAPEEFKVAIRAAANRK